MKALHDTNIARKAVVDQHVTTTDAAMIYTEQQAAGLELLNTMGVHDGEEPMEIGAARHDAKEEEIRHLRLQNEKMTTRLAKQDAKMTQLEGRMKQLARDAPPLSSSHRGNHWRAQPPTNQGRGSHRPGNHLTPRRRATRDDVCWACGLPGHFQMNCRSRGKSNQGADRYRRDNVSRTAGQAGPLNLQGPGATTAGTRPNSSQRMV